jgi:hypothetical protein
LLLLTAAAPLAGAQTAQLPDPTSEAYCKTVQRILANTELTGTNTIFTDMPAYRASKPMAEPHEIFQVVVYDGELPVMVSCKVKGAAHLRAAFGEEVAGEQLYCPTIAGLAQAQAVADLQAAGDSEAAARAAAIVVDDNEPYATGRSFLSDFQLSYAADDGTVHLSSPGLFHDYDSWTTLILPDRFEGQVYCHSATAAYIKALATGSREPGLMIQPMNDDAPATPTAAAD